MKVIFAVAMGQGTISGATHRSLLIAREILNKADIPNDELNLEGSCYISHARNKLVADFLEGDGTDLIFIDDDVEFTPDSVLKLLKHQESIVGGVYPFKKDIEEYPVTIKTDENGYPYGKNGLIEATGLPTGFLKIKREVFTYMMEKYPALKYYEDGKEYYDLFGCAVMFGRWYGDDLAFCKRWELLGGTMWLEPDITFFHIGKKKYKGNFHEYLIELKEKEAFEHSGSV